MANVFVDEASLQAIAGAIRAKNGSTATYKPGQMAAAIQAIETGGGGLEINGIIDKYVVAAGGSVSAGDFVQFVNEYAAGTDTQLSSTSNAGMYISAVELSDNRVLIVHGTGTGSTSYLYGIVVTISGTTVTAGVNTKLSSTTYSGLYMEAVRVNANTAMILHVGTSSGYLYAIAVSVNGTTITAGNDVAVRSSQTAGTASGVLISEGKVLAAYYSLQKLYASVVSVSGTTVTVGTAVELASSGYGLQASAVKIGENLAAIFYGAIAAASKYLYVVTAKINGTTVTKETEPAMIKDTTYSGERIKATMIDDLRILLIHSDTSNRQIYGMIATINGEGITPGTDKILVSISSSGQSFDVVKTGENEFFLFCKDGTYLRAMPLTVNKEGIQAKTSFLLSSESYSGFAISAVQIGGTTLIAHSMSSSYKLNALPRKKKISKVSDRAIAGVAKTGGSAGTTVEIYLTN